MRWNLSYENFKIYGPDHPSQQVFEEHFQTSRAWIAWLPLERLGDVIDHRRMSTDLAEIENDVGGDAKWEMLKEFLATNSAVAPPWAVMMPDTKKLGPAHGMHRLQYAIYIQMKTIPIVLNSADAALVNSMYGFPIEEMEP